MSAGKGEAWVITFTTELRKQLGEKFIITHARTSASSLGAYTYLILHFSQPWHLGKFKSQLHPAQ